MFQIIKEITQAMKPLSGNKIKTIGVMSGTSLDGLDLAAVEFQLQNNSWSFEIIEAETIPYTKEWLEKLQSAPAFSGEQLTQLHSEYGKYTGLKIKEFIKSINFNPDIIASHGHTIFHQPEKHFTLQIGNGAEIAAQTEITTITDFRITDVALGGQGAPLVPIGDKYLFSDFDYCLNLGGFANVSFEQDHQRIAYDICPANLVLNYFAEKNGFVFDKNGMLGKQGEINTELLEKLNQLPYYAQIPPKSLGREWVEKSFFPVLDTFEISDLDKMRTIYEHIAIQISKISSNKGKLLITGGGAFNSFLIECIKRRSTLQVMLPDAKIIDFKEALIFAFLGVLRIQNKTNCLASVTGALKDSSCGVIFSA